MLFFQGRPSIHSKLSHVILTIIVVGLFVHTCRLSQSYRWRPTSVEVEVLPEGNASPEELYFARLARQLSLTQETSWRSWRIQPMEQSADWPSVTDVNLNFKSVTPRIINLAAPARKDLFAHKRMELPVPSSVELGHIDASDFLFGVSTTYARITHDKFAMVKAWSRWLTDAHHHSNGASLVVVLDQAANDQLGEIDRMLQASGIDCWVTTTEEPMSMARRYFELARIMNTFAATMAADGQNKRWFGLLEDDIFFPSLSHLRDRLFSYNSDGQHYIALPSEKADWQVDDKKLTTYGGGAIMLTRTSISRVPSLPCFESGKDAGPPFKAKRWDGLLHDCIMNHSNLDMHVLPGFYSPNDDTYDQTVNSYEMGVQPLLLRRYQERHYININKAHLVTNVCGESCFMQRYLFRDNIVLVNGISISEYPDGVKVDHSTSLEARSEGGDFSRLSVPERVVVDDDQEVVDKAALTWNGRPTVWRFMDSAMSKDGAVWQAYVKKAKVHEDAPAAEKMDSVIVLIWEGGKPPTV